MLLHTCLANNLTCQILAFVIKLVFVKGGVLLNKKQINIVEEILASVGLESIKASEPRNILKKIS